MESMIITGVGIIIVVLAFLQALLLLVGHRARLSQAKVASQYDLEVWDTRVQQAKITLENNRQQHANTWSGLRKFEIKRKEFENDTRSICSFYLFPHDEKPLPPFKPGQFLTFDLKVPGQERSVVRCYSLSDAPTPDYYRVSIRQVPDGLSSSHFHQVLKEGDIVDARAPAGVFFIEPEDNSPIVMIAGGVGITPFLSMLSTIANVSPSREAWLFYSGRTLDDFVKVKELEKIARTGRNLHVHFCVTDEPGGLPDTPNYHTCRVGVDLFEELLPSQNYDYYMCGPRPMMVAIEDALQDWGVPKAKIHWEDFAPMPATPKKDASGPSDLKITFKKSDKEVQWDDSFGPLRNFAFEQGVDIPISCGAGNCGTCLTAIREGEVEYLAEPGFPDLSEGECLPCVCIPKTNLELDA